MAALLHFEPAHRVPTASRSRVAMTRMSGCSNILIPLMLALVFAGCDSSGPDNFEKHYVVTASPIDVGVGSGLCLAVDLKDPRGVWWWQPGKDCSKRTTGPHVFPAQQAVVTRGQDGGTADIRFRVPVHRGLNAADRPYIDVRLELKDGRLGSPGTGNWVNTISRRDLEIPEMWR